MLPKAKKTFSQNFLVDENVVAKIIEAAEIKKGENILEIGPGTGVLTRALFNAGARVTAVEADQDLIPLLRAQFGDRIRLIHGDALLLHDSTTPRLHYSLVSNLPYSITSAVLETYLTIPPRPVRMVLMVQREVADRITATPPHMSLLSVVCQLYAQCTRIITVKAGAFRPIPKVDSAVVRLDVYQHGHPELNGKNSEQVIALAKRGFASKRKQLKTNLGKHIVPKLRAIGLDEKIRAENLTVSDWIRFAS